MRKLYPLVLSFILTTITFSAYGQGATKYPLYEHFTNASCPPCAVQNPIFDALYSENENRVNHIAYHTSWPGRDPMYSANTTEQNEMVAFYGIRGVPSMIFNGSSIGGPANASQGQINAAASQTSPIKLTVRDNPNGMSRNVGVTIESVMAPPAGSYIIRVAVIESMIEYTSAPGTNGERDFPNVFRDMLTSTAGESITLLPQGGKVNLSYTYTPDPSWDMDNIYVIAYVQNTGTREILNSGASNVPTLEVTPTTATILKASAQNTFSIDMNETEADQMIQVTLDAKQPMDWTASFDIDGTTYQTTASFMSSAAAVKTLDLNVVPGSMVGVGEYKLTIEAVNSGAKDQEFEFVVISGVTDLIINIGDADAYENIFATGMQAAGNTTSASMGDAKLGEGITSNALDGVINLYINAGESADALTDGNVLALQTFLQNGGRLFIAGQDVGYGAMSSGSASSTSMVQGFFTTVLKAQFISDGNNQNLLLTPFTSDALYGNLSAGGIVQTHGNNFTPDEIGPATIGVRPIFTYNANRSKTAGIRTETSAYKAVVIGVGMEMLQDVSLAYQILKISHDWFYDGISTSVFDAAMEDLMEGSAYPQPASDIAYIPVTGDYQNLNIRLMDASGRLIREEAVPAGLSTFELQVQDLASGLYFYQLTDGERIGKAQKLMVE
ncbi:MAG: Omp28-related outer membrane protein [Bacteroidota bacterium]